MNDVPAETADAAERRIHAEGILRDTTGKLGVVVGNEHHERVQLALRSETGNGGERFLGFAFHARAVADGADGDAIILRELIADGEALRLRERTAERTVAQKNAFGIQVRFAMAGELAVDAAETFHGLGGHAVKAVERTHGIDAVFAVARVVDEIVSLMPFAAADGEHHAVDRRHNLRERRRTAPVRGRTADDRVQIHERHERTAGARIGERHISASAVFDRDRIFRRGLGGGREFGFE